MKTTILFLACALFIVGCDRGISPSNASPEPGFGGAVRFMSKAPPPDSVKDFRVVAVPYYPIDSSVTVLISKIFSREIFYTPSPVAVGDSGTFSAYALLVRPGRYKYVAVVQQFGQNILKDWRVVSIYGFSASTPQPATVAVRNDQFIYGIDLFVDFNNLPPQPFKP